LGDIFDNLFHSNLPYIPYARLIFMHPPNACIKEFRGFVSIGLGYVWPIPRKK
jgi:hypothetical protein